MTEIKKFEHKKHLTAKIIYNDLDYRTGSVVCVTDGYIHILDEEDSTMSFIIPWKEIKEVTLFEDECDK